MALIYAVLGALALQLLGSELYDRAPRLSRALIRCAVKRLPNGVRHRYEEEWLAHQAECPGNLSKLVHGVGCFLCAPRVSAVVRLDEYRVEFGIEQRRGDVTKEIMRGVKLDGATYLGFVRVMRDTEWPDNIREFGTGWAKLVSDIGEPQLDNDPPNKTKVQELRRAFCDVFEEALTWDEGPYCVRFRIYGPKHPSNDA